MKPLAIDLFCGLGGWSEGLLAEGFNVIGFDIEQHVYGQHRYPAQLVVQDVLTLHGRQFRWRSRYNLTGCWGLCRRLGGRSMTRLPEGGNGNVRASCSYEVSTSGTVLSRVSKALGRQ